MIVDELGTLTFSEVDTRTNALAHALSDAGIVEGDGVGIMCRNHRGFIEATIAVSKLGADALYLNTAFAGPQLTEVVQREKPKAIIFDEEFYGLLAEAGTPPQALRRLARLAELPDDPTLDELIVRGRSERRGAAGARGTRRDPHLAAPRARPRAPRAATRSRSTRPCRYLSRIPLKTRQVIHIAAPLFHSWGFAHFSLGLILGEHLRAAAQVRPRGLPGRGRALRAPTRSRSCR